jgi:acyl-CoA hydrolase
VASGFLLSPLFSQFKKDKNHGEKSCSQTYKFYIHEEMYYNITTKNIHVTSMKNTQTALIAIIAGGIMAFSQTAHATPQPHLQASLAALDTALNELNLATPDKGGYRRMAINNVNNAIKNVNSGIRYSNNH